MKTIVVTWCLAWSTASALRHRNSTAVETGALASNSTSRRIAPRMLVVAGLEGTGHHFFKSLFDNCPNVQQFKLPQWNQLDMEAHHHPAGWPPSMLSAATLDLRSRVNSAPGRILGFDPFSTSWPNGHGTHWQRMHEMQPDLTLLKKAADAAGVEMRIIVMRREFRSVLKSTCVHRTDLEPCPAMTETLAANMNDMTRQLRTFDSSMYSCYNYGDTADLENKLAGAVAGSTGLGITAHEAIARSWKPGAGLSNGYQMRHEKPTTYEANVTNFERLMAQPILELDSLCNVAHFA